MKRKELTMNNSIVAPSNSSNSQSKDTNITRLNPQFDDSIFDPEKIINHIKQLVKKNEPILHTEILNQLIEQFEPLDFEMLAFPEVEEFRKQLENLNPENEQAKDIRKRLDKIKVNAKHYRILSIKNVSKTALKNRWGLCKNNDFIYLYNGTYWAEIDKEVFQKFLGEAAEKMGVRWDNAQDYLFREQLFKQFLATEYINTPQVKNNIVLINLKNGTFEISPLGTKLRPFNCSDFITYQLPFDYNPQASAPLFEEYLNKVLPDKESQRILAEYLGYVFIKHSSNTLKEEKALILYGAGANGKSVLFDIVTALMGRENVSNYTLQNLTEEKGFYRAKIANKLLNYCSDISTKLEVAMFKQLVSGEPVEACLKYGQPFTMNDYSKFIFNCNELPKDIEHSNAYYRRFLIIPFCVTIPEQDQDKQLSYKIIDKELSGVFNWVLEGLNRLLEQKRFSHCEAAKQAIEQYKTESNSIKLFLDESGYKNNSTDYQLIKDLYPEYRNYCIADGMIAFKKINFSKQLQALGVSLGRESGTGQKIAYLKKDNSSF